MTPRIRALRRAATTSCLILGATALLLASVPIADARPDRGDRGKRGREHSWKASRSDRARFDRQRSSYARSYSDRGSRRYSSDRRWSGNRRSSDYRQFSSRKHRSTSYRYDRYPRYESRTRYYSRSSPRYYARSYPRYHRSYPRYHSSYPYYGSRSGFSFSFAITNYAPAGYYYYDSYCGDRFASLGLYLDHVHACHYAHPTVIQIYAVHGGGPICAYEYDDGYWEPYY